VPAHTAGIPVGIGKRAYGGAQRHQGQGKENHQPIHSAVVENNCRSDKENIRQQVEKVMSHPWLPDSIPVRGFIYDIKSGKLNEVKQ
jgi:carbonic anhydrase